MSYLVRFFISISLLFVFNSGYSQKIIIVDNTNNQPVSNVTVFGKQSLKSLISDNNGIVNIEEFDKNQINYFTREAFDFYYPGYGSSYPSVMGAVGMLTEQGGIAGGRAIRTNDGYILTLRQRIFDHYTTSLATLKKSAERKDIFLKYTYETLNPKNKSINKLKTFLRNKNNKEKESTNFLRHLSPI